MLKSKDARKLLITLLLISMLMLSAVFSAVPIMVHAEEGATSEAEISTDEGALSETACEEEDPVQIEYFYDGAWRTISGSPGPIVWTGPCDEPSFTVTMRARWHNPPDSDKVNWVNVKMVEKSGFGITFYPSTFTLYNEHPTHRTNLTQEFTVIVPVGGLGAGTYNARIYADVTDQGPGKTPNVAGTDGYFQFVKEVCLPPEATISGVKFHDLDADGERDTSEMGLEGWTIQLWKLDTDWSLVSNTTTGDAGDYIFTVTTAGKYRVTEVLKPGWKQTAPLAGNYTFEVVLGQTYSGKDFGNVELKADLSITKSGPKYAHVGDEITYTFKVTNHGPDAAKNVIVTDLLLGGVIYGPKDLASGASETFTVKYTVLDDDPDPLNNTATVISGTPDPDETNNEASWSVDILHPEIDVTKTADKTKAYAGETITYTIIVTNTGDCTLYCVNVTDTLLGSIWSGTLGVSENKTFTYTYTYTVKVGDPDPLVNTVTASGKDILGLIVTDKDTAEVDLIAKICGYKFYDANADGELDDGENGLEGWTIELWLNGKMIAWTTTGSDGSYCFDGLDAGEYTVKEVGQRYWKSTTPNNLTVDLSSGEISEGNNFGNTKLVTRTQGFWATHKDYTSSVWLSIPAGERVIGSKNMGDGNKDVEEMFGAFWSSISTTSNGARRSLLDQARMQLVQQLVAAMLNVKAFGDDDLGTGASLIAQGKAAFDTGTRAQILSIANQLAAFNQSGSTEPLPPSVIPGPADPTGAQKIANRKFWDTLNQQQ